MSTVWLVPQPIGGYLDLLWSGQGGSVLEEGRILVIDPGFFSVDWVLIEEGDIRRPYSGTSLEAMSVLLDQASRLIADEHGGVVPIERIEEALRTGKGHVLLFGRAMGRLRCKLFPKIQGRGLDPYILYTVALVESAKVSKQIAKPWPWALNRQGRPFIPSSLAEAKDILGGALAKGIRNIDVGLMQVNIRWQGHRVSQPEDLLDPETNLRVGADVLAAILLT